MPNARPASSAARRSATRARGRAPASRPRPPRGVRARLPVSQIHWDRKLRLLMLGVLALVGWVGLHGFMSVLAARSQANAELSLVSSLDRQNRALERQVSSLHQPATIVRDARALGMVRSGERSYVVTGLPAGH